MGVFYQSIPAQGIPSRERTVVRVLYDAEYLYIGAVMYDSDPEALVSAGLEQDFATQNSDIFGFALDTYLDRQNAFLFAVNPAGAVFDAQAFNDQQSVNRAWEGVVDVATAVHEDGWTTEARVPFTTLRYRDSEEPQSWGLNFSRRIRRHSEDSSWAPLSRQFRVYKMSRAGTLNGLEGLRPGRNLSIKPFVTAQRDGGRGLSGENQVDGGVDLKWGITPRLTLDLTGADGLFPGGSGRTADQPEPLLSVLPREAGLLPGERRHLQLPGKPGQELPDGIGSAELQALPQPSHRPLVGQGPLYRSPEERA